MIDKHNATQLEVAAVIPPVKNLCVRTSRRRPLR